METVDQSSCTSVFSWLTLLFLWGLIFFFFLLYRRTELTTRQWKVCLCLSVVRKKRHKKCHLLRKESFSFQLQGSGSTAARDNTSVEFAIATTALYTPGYLLWSVIWLQEGKKDSLNKRHIVLKERYSVCLCWHSKQSDLNWGKIKGWQLEYENHLFCPACHLINFPLMSHCDRTRRLFFSPELHERTKMSNIRYKKKRLLTTINYSWLFSLLIWNVLEIVILAFSWFSYIPMTNSCSRDLC